MCAHLSATRIMRSRFLPSSLGLTLLVCGGKKICHAARSFRAKSASPPGAVLAAGAAPTYAPPLAVQCIPL